MSEVLILRDPRESVKKCSLTPLRGLEGVRFLEYAPDRLLVVVGDEFRDQVASHHLLLGEVGDVGGLLVPLADAALGVDAEDRGVRAVDELRQLCCELREDLVGFHLEVSSHDLRLLRTSAGGRSTGPKQVGVAVR